MIKTEPKDSRRIKEIQLTRLTVEEKEAVWKRFIAPKLEPLPNSAFQNPCLIWQGSKFPVNRGSTEFYGRWAYEKVDLITHRVAHILKIGPIPDKLKVCHRCKGNKLCSEPSHLYAGTDEDNARDRIFDGTHTMGSHNPMAKINEVIASNIKLDISKGVSNNALLEKYSDLTESILRSIKSGQSWATDETGLARKKSRQDRRKETRKQIRKHGLQVTDYENAWKNMLRRVCQEVTNNHGKGPVTSTIESPCFLLKPLASGYGGVDIRGVNFRAHIVSWEYHHNNCKMQNDKTKLVSHKCNTPNCVNPEHLVLETYAENTARIKIAGNQNPPVKYSEEICNEAIKLVSTTSLTKREIAKRLGMSKSEVSYITNGQRSGILEDSNLPRKRGERVDLDPDSVVKQFRNEFYKIWNASAKPTKKHILQELSEKYRRHPEILARWASGKTRKSAGGPLVTASRKRKADEL